MVVVKENRWAMRYKLEKEQEREQGQFEQCLDALGQDSEAQMVMIRATNRLEILGPALRRAVRFDREIALGIPDRGVRERILAVVGRDLKLAQGTDLCRLPMLSPATWGRT